MIIHNEEHGAVRSSLVQIQELASRAKRELRKMFDSESMDEEELKYYEITKLVIGRIGLLAGFACKDLSRAEDLRNIRMRRKDNNNAERAE